MAEGQTPRDERTEEPTPHRLAEARREGNAPFSREPAQALVLLAGLLWLASLAPAALGDFAGAARRLLENVALIDLEAAVIGPPLGELGTAAGLVLAPLLVLVVVAPLLAGIAQRGAAAHPDKLAPKLERVNPLAGLGRLVAAQNLVEFAKNLVKVVAAATIVALLLASEVSGVLASLTRPLVAVLGSWQTLSLRVLAAIVAFAVLIAAADMLWQYFSWRRNLRMSRKELKDELKSTEGHPEIKAKIRRLQHERARRRMLLDVPKAAVVITNPTHYAVALTYDALREPVPRLVAKGRDLVAGRIREVAAEARVPTIADPPLARLLHATLEIGDTIRPEHYRAVAEIISFVLAQRDRGGFARQPDSLDRHQP